MFSVTLFTAADCHEFGSTFCGLVDPWAFFPLL